MSSSLLKGSLLFSLGTFASRIFGLLRESVIASVFGASQVLDAFFIANRIPNMLRELLAEGALGASFTKVFSQLMVTDQQRAKRLLIDACWMFFIFLILVSILGYIGAPYFIEALTIRRSYAVPTHDPLLAESIHLTRVLFPFIGFMSLGAIFGGALSQQNKFLTTSVAPILLNAGYIIGALCFAPLLKSHFFAGFFQNYSYDLGILGLALGVLLGGFLQTLMQFLALIKPFFKGQNLRPSQWRFTQDLKQVLKLMGPMIIGSSAGQINVLVNTNFATALQEGAVSWLSFAFRILQLPIGLFGVAVATVALPSLSKKIAENRPDLYEQVSKLLGKSTQLTLWMILPCFAFFVFNSKHLIELLFHYGNFSSFDMQQTSETLVAYGFGMMGYGMIKVMSSFYYAFGKTSFPMFVGLFSIAVNYLCNAYLVDQFGHVGLAYTASIVLSLNALILILGSLKMKVTISPIKITKSLSMMLIFVKAAFFIQEKTSDLWPLLAGSIASSVKAKALLVMGGNGICVLLLALLMARLDYIGRLTDKR